MNAITAPPPTPSAAATRPVIACLSRGAGSLEVLIECRISMGLPAIVIVGVAGKTVSEARERIRGAFASSGLRLPAQRISINLAPADIPKNSPGLDLALAVAILRASGQVPAPSPSDHVFIGELGLDGSVRPVRGIIGQLVEARQRGLRSFFVPEANLPQALLVPGIAVMAVSSLERLVQHLRQNEPLSVTATGSGSRPAPPGRSNTGDDLSDVAGQPQAKRALIIAAAGGHNLLLTGPPGTGKSMLAKLLPELLPPLSHEEMLAVTHLHSLAGPQYGRLVSHRPLRAPHHSTGLTALLGGGASARPGELSLAHYGVLLFDELPEFPRPTLEALRQPLEDRRVVITRQHETAIYPAEALFVGTANPCPCGYYGSDSGPACVCTVAGIARYKQRLSGPLLDRIDLCVNVAAVPAGQLLRGGQKSGPTSASARRLVAAARRRQAARYKATTVLNRDLTNRQLSRHARLCPGARELMQQAGERLHLSARAYLRTIKVARTIADLAGTTEVTEAHAGEALQYRHY